MKQWLNKLGIDIKLLKFGAVGIINTLFGTAIMFTLFDVFNFGYYFSSFCNYFFGSILSYFLNKYFTFNYKKKDVKTIVKFIIGIAACYLIAYGGCRPIARAVFSSFGEKIADNIAMIGGMGVFVILNYYSQRFFVFRNLDRKENEE